MARLRVSRQKGARLGAVLLSWCGLLGDGGGRVYDRPAEKWRVDAEPIQTGLLTFPVCLIGFPLLKLLGRWHIAHSPIVR